MSPAFPTWLHTLAILSLALGVACAFLIACDETRHPQGASHCGAGCTLGDIIAEWTAFALPGVAVWFGWHSVFAEKMFAVAYPAGPEGRDVSRAKMTA